MLKNVILWVVIAVVLMSVFNNFAPRGERGDTSLSYSQFIQSVKMGQVQSVMIDENVIKGKMQTGEHFKTYAPNDPHMVDDLLEGGVEIKALPPEQPSFLMQLLVS